MNRNPAHTSIAVWLLICCALVYAMVVLGGVTRLTGSGLSMVEWGPIMGAIPPLNEAQWQATFDAYKQFPEYQKKNFGMDLAGFKSIFWLEYFHRLLGRSIGIVFLLPFLYFLARGRIDRPLVPKLVTMFVLGGLQGALGWYMVKSGLVDNPHVSPFRLTAHLGLALLIYAYMLWVALGLLFPRPEPTIDSPDLRPWLWAFISFAGVTIASGGFVAGTKAGYAYNTFPLMDGELFPSAYFLMEPAWLNLFENIAAVQFNHRLLAISLLVFTVLLWRGARDKLLPYRARLHLNLLMAMVVVQVVLGISTLLLHMPIWLAATHQAGAVAVLTFALLAVHPLRREESEK